MQTITGMVVLAAGLLLAACGGDDVCYGGPGSNVCDVATLTIELDKTSIKSVSASPPEAVTVTVTALNESGDAASGVPISFLVDNGATCTPSASKADASGVATAIVIATADTPGPGTIKVVAASGVLKATASITVIGP